MDDLAVIRRVLAGDPDAYRVLVVRYQRPLFKFLRTFNLPHAIVEEIAQEAFLRAYAALPSYDPARGGSFSTWLFTIAKNAAINEAGKASARQETHVEARGRGVTPTAAREDRDGGATPAGQHDALERAEQGSMLRRALGALPQAFRSAVVLAYLKELSIDEIAAIERCSVGTVKSRIFRGKRLLAAALARTEG